MDWPKRRVLVEDLEAQRRAIVEQVAPDDPAEALSLMWQFLALATPTLDRCDNSSGAVIGVFTAAVADLGEIASAAHPDPKKLADDVYQALTRNDYGQYDNLIGILAPTLGPEGLEHLNERMVALSDQPVDRSSGAKRQVVGYGSGGPVYADEMAERSRLSTARLALMDIADAQGDVDAFIAQHDEPTRRVSKVAAGIARRLLAAGRTEDARQAIEAAEPRSGGWDRPDVDRPDVDWPDFDWPDFGWEDARIEVLEALGRSDEAQTARWSCYERSLSGEHLRAYLKRLPDFEDVEAEERALDHAQSVRSLLQALAFLVS